MRVLAFGDAALMDGFALLGIETFAGAGTDTIETVLNGLLRERERALVYIQQDLMLEDIPVIAHLRAQGGSILISEIPSLRNVDEYRPQVEKLIGRVLGASMLERKIDD